MGRIGLMGRRGEAGAFSEAGGRDEVFGEDAEHGDRDGRASISVVALDDSETGKTPVPLFLRRCCSSISEMSWEAVLSL